MSGIDERVAVLETDSTNFKQWQHNQDKAITGITKSMTDEANRLDTKFEKIYLLLIAQLGTAAITLAAVLFGGKH